MAWTAPRDWNTGEVETAAIFNTHVRDNLKYLKGDAGTIAFAAGATFAGDTTVTGRLLATVSANNTSGDITLDGSYGSVNDYHQLTWQQASAIRGIATAGGQMGFDFILQDGASGSINAGRNVMRMRGDGYVGIGTTSPQGRIHALGAVSGVLYWEFNGVDGTARTVIPDGTGDVLGTLAGFFSVFDGTNRTAGPISGVAVTATLAANFNLMTSTGTYTLHLNSNGSVDVQRTAGSGSAKVALWLIWT